MPRPRLQEQTDDQHTNENNVTSNDFMLPSNAGHLCVPRTPGVDGGGQVNQITQIKTNSN